MTATLTPGSDDFELAAAPASEFDGRDLDTLAADLDVEYSNVVEHLASAVHHSIRCGEILLAARKLIIDGTWQKWLTANTELNQNQAAQFMRLAYYRDLLPPEAFSQYVDHRGMTRSATWKSALTYLAGLPPFVIPGWHHVPAELKAEARRLHDEGMTYVAIGNLVGRSATSIKAWCNPERTRIQERSYEKRKKQHDQLKRAEAAERAADERERKLNQARIENASLSDVEVLLERAITILEATVDNHRGDARDAIRYAVNHCRKAAGEVVNALEASVVAA